jgi:hypothetical protein
VQFAKHLGLALGGMNGRQDHVEFELFGRYLGDLLVGNYGAG